MLAEFDYDEATGEQTLRRYFVDGPLYVDEHLLMHGATTGDVDGQDGFTAPVDITSKLTFDPTNGAWVATVDLRAERDGNGDGRNYTIDIEAVDAQGNIGHCSTCVVVPHDRRRGSR